MEREKWFLEKRRIGTWGFCFLCFKKMWLIKMFPGYLGLLIEFTARVHSKRTKASHPWVRFIFFVQIRETMLSCLLSWYSVVDNYSNWIRHRSVVRMQYTWYMESVNRWIPWVDPLICGTYDLLPVLIPKFIDEWSSLAIDNFRGLIS